MAFGRLRGAECGRDKDRDRETQRQAVAATKKKEKLHKFSYRFLREALIRLSYRFSREATGQCIDKGVEKTFKMEIKFLKGEVEFCIFCLSA